MFPVIVPPARAKYVDAAVADVKRALNAVPESCATFAVPVNVTTLPETPFVAQLTILSAVREFTAPEIVPTFDRLLVPIKILPLIVPPANGK